MPGTAKRSYVSRMSLHFIFKSAFTSREPPRSAGGPARRPGVVSRPGERRVFWGALHLSVHSWCSRAGPLCAQTQEPEFFFVKNVCTKLCSSLKDVLGARVWQLRNTLQDGDPLPAERQGLRPSPGRRVGCDSFLRHRTVAGWPQARRWVGIHQAALPTSGGEATSRCSDQQLWPSPAVLTHSAMAQPRVTSSTAGQRRSQPPAGPEVLPPGLREHNNKSLAVAS